MNPTKTSFVTAAGVTFAALSVVYGSYARDCLDNGKPVGTLNDPTPQGYEVSNNQIPEDDFYRGLVSLLKREYVEPITDERKLAIGAVKGMVESLQDPRSMFMNPDEFRVYMNAREGKYEGVGVDLAFDKGHPSSADSLTPADMEQLSIPRLKVVAVTPGGPADRAGVRPGDWVESVESHWVLNPLLVEQYRSAVATLNGKDAKTVSASVSKARQDQVTQIGKTLKAKLDTMIMPAKARDMLTIGDKGAVTVVWHRGDGLRTTTIVRKDSEVPEVQSDGDVITVRFSEGSADKLRKVIAGKSDVILDLRDNSNGDFQAMEQCLSVVAPSGTYGYLHSDKPGKSRTFSIATGNPRPPKMTILVDSSTRGAADIFASALAYKHLAKLHGVSSNDKSVIEVVSLPDGSGYTLATSEYVTQQTSPKRVVFRKDEAATSVAMRDADGNIVAMAHKHGGNA